MNPPHLVRSFVVVALVALVALGALAPRAAKAQESTPQRPWSFYGQVGVVSGSGGGAKTLMESRLASTYGLRFRIEQGPWWFGIEFTDWIARATAAGFDSIVARDPGPGAVSRDRSASYKATTLHLLIRRDVRRSGPLTLFGTVALGGTQSDGTIQGKCFVDNNGYPLCSEPPRVAHGEGMTLEASAGLGGALEYSRATRRVPGWLRWALGQELLAEVSATSQQATEARFVGIRATVGIGW